MEFKQIAKNADLVSNFNAGYLLAYIQKKGNLNTTYKELQEETGLTKGKINRALEILLSLDLLEVEREKETRNIILKIKLKIKNLSEKILPVKRRNRLFCAKNRKTYTREDLLTPEDEESLKKFHEQIDKEHKELTQKVDEILKKRQEEKKKTKLSRWRRTTK
jgi:hypothetical protein